MHFKDTQEMIRYHRSPPVEPKKLEETEEKEEKPSLLGEKKAKKKDKK